MENTDMKKCPYCAEMIKSEAIKCRYCGSNLTRKNINFDYLSTPGYWNRVNDGKKIAGVCTGIAHQVDSPMLILPLRVFFILTTIFYGFGIFLYVILWLLMPAPIDSSKDRGMPISEDKNKQEIKTESTPVTEKKEKTSET